MRDVDPIRIRDLLGNIADAQRRLRELGQLSEQRRRLTCAITLSRVKVDEPSRTMRTALPSWPNWP